MVHVIEVSSSVPVPDTIYNKSLPQLATMVYFGGQLGVMTINLVTMNNVFYELGDVYPH